MILAATGHRLGPRIGGYGSDIQTRLQRLAGILLTTLRPDYVHSGLASGWDQAVARAAIDLAIPWTAAIPFVGQEKRWPAVHQQIYRELLVRATRVRVGHGYHERDRWMVDNGTIVGALYDGGEGGTAVTVRYARQRRVPVINLWAAYTA